MRFCSLALLLLGFFLIADTAKAGPSTANRDLSLLDSASVPDEANVADEANQETEDRIGLDKRKRREVQRQLTSIGFDTKVNGTFDESTRAVIARWQGARGYPKTGFFNATQHE